MNPLIHFAYRLVLPVKDSFKIEDAYEKLLIYSCSLYQINFCFNLFLPLLKL